MLTYLTHSAAFSLGFIACAVLVAGKRRTKRYYMHVGHDSPYRVGSIIIADSSDKMAGTYEVLKREEIDCCPFEEPIRLTLERKN